MAVSGLRYGTKFRQVSERPIGKITTGFVGQLIRCGCRGFYGFYYILESAEFSPISGAEYIHSIKVLPLSDEFRKVMVLRVSQEKFREGIS